MDSPLNLPAPKTKCSQYSKEVQVFWPWLLRVTQEIQGTKATKPENNNKKNSIRLKRLSLISTMNLSLEIEDILLSFFFCEWKAQVLFTLYWVCCYGLKLISWGNLISSCPISNAVYSQGALLRMIYSLFSYCFIYLGFKNRNSFMQTNQNSLLRNFYQEMRDGLWKLRQLLHSILSTEYARTNALLFNEVIKKSTEFH